MRFGRSWGEKKAVFVPGPRDFPKLVGHPSLAVFFSRSGVADLEASLGFRSSFNFVPERYSLDREVLQELRERGFEIGVHGLEHDGKLFSSQDVFARRAERINCYLKDFGAVGFRAPLTHRQPEWMQALEIEYDLSFFDTDPFEPIPGGTMSIWPFCRIAIYAGPGLHFN